MIDDPHQFDIHVDLSDILGVDEGTAMVSERWYALTRPRFDREARMQMSLERMHRNAMLHAQWQATARRALDRRRAIRVPMLSRVHIDEGLHMTATDISLSGLRCSGRPRAPVMNVEFKIPGTKIPVDAKVEVMNFKDANVIPLVGLRFVNLERAYVEMISSYVSRRRDRAIAA